MSGFSPQWLTLRESADHRAVNTGVRKVWVDDLAAQDRVSIMDIGCGTGSNLRSLAPHLGARQVWRLVDYDAALLDAAREALGRWGDETQERGETLCIVKDGREIEVTFLKADLAANLAEVLDHPCDAVTAAAFFDLVSMQWIAKFCAEMAARRRRFYTVLTYDGHEKWTPASPEDAAVLAAFHSHQASDKGFGSAAGPGASQALVEGFQRAGAKVMTGASPWQLGPSDQALMQELARGIASAVEETGLIASDKLASWQSARRIASACEIGHLDFYAPFD